MDRILTKHVLKQGDCFIVQSVQDEGDLKSIRPDAIYSKTVLPTFNAFKLQNMSSQEAREQLHISADNQVLLFFGFVRKYKGLKYLLQAMPRVSRELSNIKLFIVGDFGSDKQEYLEMIQNLKIQAYIEIHDGYIPDKEVEKFFAASDVVVLPYESATQSGIVQIAYGFGTPVIASNVGGLPEVVVDGKTGFITNAKDSDDLAGKIIQFFNEKRADEFRNEIVKEADKYSWEHLTQTVEALIQRIRE
ncbi:MAG: glycosyltransferase family 4 protein [Bacteroides sp.]|nr:glycosyltransferase family 4 protein [Bacteroides sp.]MCM1548418.1 glycosyltransferase family 4 protein [Clostridium sp.]